MAAPLLEHSCWSRVCARSRVHDPQRIEAQDVLRRAGLSPRCAVRIRPSARQLAHSQQHPRSSTFAGLLLSDACLAAHRSKTRSMRASDPPARAARSQQHGSRSSAAADVGCAHDVPIAQRIGTVLPLSPIPLVYDSRKRESRRGTIGGGRTPPHSPWLHPILRSCLQHPLPEKCASRRKKRMKYPACSECFRRMQLTFRDEAHDPALAR